ncbi:substrate-binding domain-containing protein [Mycobacterium sp.]|uniref:substrate-binding domain-containing protein n=1 Tax=Mycobacterium sp. TaxID=1785 RepID=UPI003C70ABB5
MGRHSIPGPDDSPREPFEATPAPQHEPFEEHYPSYEPVDEQHRLETSAAPPSPEDEYSGGRFADGTWQGGHRSTDRKRRGVSVAVIVALFAVVVLVGGIILWRFFGNALSNRSDTAAAACSGSDVPVAVIADPSIADKITEFADRYNKSADPIGDRCVKLAVQAAGSNQVIDGFVGNWPSDLGQRPALWIPASSVSTSRLQAAAGSNVITDSRSLVTSPVVLAIKPQLKTALASQNWGTLPGLQTNPASLEAMNMPGWGSLRLALPTDGDSDASYLAAEAVAAASAPPNEPPTAGVGAVNTLIAGQPKLSNPSLSAAMDALMTTGDPAAAPVHAVVITEQQLYQRSAKVPDAKDVVSSWLPPGPAVVADYPMASLAGDWLTEEQMTAASEFKKFLQKPEQQAELAKAGFRAENQSLPKSDVAGFSPLSGTLSIGDDERVTLADAVTAPATGGAVTIMLDQSMSEQEGGKSRLANVVAALRNKLQALPPNAVVGLWTFDGVEGRSEVAAGPLSDQVNGQPRSAALTAALDKQYSSNGGAVSFTTLRLIYAGALANFRPGMKNSVLVITSGPHTDQSLDGAGLQDYVRTTFDPARPVAINVIDFGADPDRGAWESVAQATGGSYQNLTTSDTPDLTTAVSTFLG